MDPRRWMIVVMALLAPGAVLAQSSASYRLQEHALNAGGRPMDAVVSTSASFRLTLDSIDEPIARRGLWGMSYILDGGMTPTYGPPGEVEGLDVLGDLQTLVWSFEPASDAYNLYSGSLSTLPGMYGGCAASRVGGTTTVDPSLPAPGDGLFYIVTGENRLRQEGTKGLTSVGAERANPAPCP